MEFCKNYHAFIWSQVLSNERSELMTALASDRVSQIITCVIRGEEYARALKQLESLLSAGKQYAIMDMSLADASGVALHELNGMISVSMSLPFVLKEGNTITVYRVSEDGTNVLCDSAIQDGVLTFSTNHFSAYAFIEVAESAANDTAADIANATGKAASPKTDDASTAMPMLLLFLFATASFMVHTAAKRR